MIRVMKLLGKISHSVGKGWLTSLWVFVIAYFGYHAFQGDNSFSKLKLLQAQQAEVIALAKETALARTLLENRIEAMRASGLDPDMLEEQVRLKLGFTHPDEVILFLE